MPIPVKTLTETLCTAKINSPIRSISGLVDVMSSPLNSDTFAINFEPVDGVTVLDGCLIFNGVTYQCMNICSAVSIIRSLNIELLWKEEAYRKTLKQ